MDTTDNTDNTEPAEATSSLLDRAKALRSSVIDRVTAVADSGKQLLADRRDQQRRNELLQELGALHLAVANGDDLDLPEAERLIAELTEVDNIAENEDGEADQAGND